VVAGKHILTYGGNARRNNFDISLAPDAKDRNELGAYLLEELLVGRFRFPVGVRLDKFGNLDHPVLSWRAAVLFKPTRKDAIRASFSRAFRPPSVVDNYLDQDVLAPPGLCCDLRGLRRPAAVRAPDLVPLVLTPFPLVVRNVGNPNLKEESLNEYELAYTRTVGGRTTLSLAAYQNDRRNEIVFTRLQPGVPAALGGGQLPRPGCLGAAGIVL
jgi:outer membrane receptor protein involved in Fe transport